VHRDLKPGNVMLTKTGAKLMDFGLAKASQLSPAAATSGLTATLTTPPGSHPLTAQGVVVRTFQYMAPEQVEGKESDARSEPMAAISVSFADGKLKRIDTAGQNLQIACDAPNGRGGMWNENGNRLRTVIKARIAM
jgi:serine/threonine protein kinase